MNNEIALMITYACVCQTLEAVIMKHLHSISLKYSIILCAIVYVSSIAKEGSLLQT